MVLLGREHWALSWLMGWDRAVPTWGETGVSCASWLCFHPGGAAHAAHGIRVRLLLLHLWCGAQGWQRERTVVLLSRPKLLGTTSW